MRRRAVKEETVVQPVIKEVAVLEPTAVEEFIAIAPEEVQILLQRGKYHFEAGRYTEALEDFESLLKIAPGNIKNRVWIRKVKEKLTTPKIETLAEGEAAPVAEEMKPKECVWMKLGMVSYRLCTSNYDCLACEFDQMMQEQMASGETPELDAALERFKGLPGNQRVCRYALRGDISYRLCTRLFQCTTCEFGQNMEDATQQKLAQRVTELAARQEALGKKEQSWWWSYWS